MAACADHRLSGRVARRVPILRVRMSCRCHLSNLRTVALIPSLIYSSGLLAVFPMLVTSHVVASNWQSRVGGSLSDPAGFDPSRSSAALWENRFEVHPDTPRDDPVFRLLGAASRPLTPR